MRNFLKNVLKAFRDPEPVKRDLETQGNIDHLTSKMALYNYVGCLYCYKVQRVIKELNLKIELRNIRQDKTHYITLIKYGGRATVPCLLTQMPDGADQWLYESTDIINYLYGIASDS